MLCHAIIGRAGGKELIMKSAVSCEFITPVLEFSADNVFFRVDKVMLGPYVIDMYLRFSLAMGIICVTIAANSILPSTYLQEGMAY